MSRPAPQIGNQRVARAFAPASIGNVAVGFDVLGQALQGVGDTVTVTQTKSRTIVVKGVTGVTTKLPRDSEQNTATVAARAMRNQLNLDAGFEITIDKGIPLGSGMGGSAASAVATVVAINSMLKIPLPVAELFPYALAGEAVASGSVHGDNVAPSLLGGLTVVAPRDDMRVVSLPVPAQLRCVLVHPNLTIETRAAREILADPVDLELAVAQSANLAGLICGCYTKDVDLIGACLADVLVEPLRAGLIPGFDDVKQAAKDAGALGCSIAGSGPAMFAWFGAESHAIKAADTMAAAFQANGLESEAYVSLISAPGARVLTE